MTANDWAGLQACLSGGLRIVAACVLCAAAARAQSDSTELAPPRAGLRPVPIPRLEDLEPAVANQLRDERRSFEALADGANASSQRLADAYGSLGRVFHVYEFFASAESSYLNANRLAPGDVRWLHLLGYLYQQTGRMQEAAERFEQARRARPEDRAATIRLGQVYLGMNRLREAREQFESVSAVFPALSRQGLGEVALRERRFEEAIAHFRAVLDRAPQATSIHYSIAMAYRGLGRLEEAQSHIERRGAGGVNVGDPIVDSLQDLVRGERGLIVRGRRAYEGGRFEEAATWFAKAIESAPTSVTARVNLGLTRLQLGDTTGAVAHLQAAFDMAPSDPDTGRELLRVLLRLGQKDEAIRILMKSRSISPDDEDTTVSLSILLAEQERFGEAVSLLNEANQRFPDRAATATTLSRLLSSSPDRSVRDGRRAHDLATRVYETEPTPVHGETIALALAELGRCDEALTWMKRAVAEAELANNAAEAARLRSEIAKYDSVSCRP
jgi:tetratricopeptide (TPR) repeat protein